MRLRSFCSLVLTFALLLSLGACGTPNAPDPSTDSNATPQEQATPDTNSPSGSTPPLRLTLPEGLSAQVVSKIPASALPIELQILDDSQAAKDDLLKNASTDLILLSLQDAADLHRSGNAIQLVALVSLETSDDPESIQCLLGSAGFLETNHDLVARFLTEYEGVVSSGSIEGAFLSISWDMVDLVQECLEEQYAKSPDSKHSIPDGTFYYLPS